MAKLRKIPSFLGTRDGLCTYMMRGEFFARSASSLTAERVLTEAAFAETRRYSNIMGKASRIASQVYKQIKGKHKTHELYRSITGQAYKMIKEGEDENTIVKTLAILNKS